MQDTNVIECRKILLLFALVYVFPVIAEFTYTRIGDNILFRNINRTTFINASEIELGSKMRNY